uniref:Reverse transcriptase domain-containing protein n=2 Tax=Aegilops tauschii subsp. strangulata TaxID=200361 RepID=A0A453K783_AEGTS
TGPQKHADASTLNDYQPISLIHLVAKIFAKVLSLRLAPKLDGLVSRSQNAFIAGRSLHDNLMSSNRTGFSTSWVPRESC